LLLSKETFEKCSILFKIKPPARRAYAPEGKAKILGAGIDDTYFEDLPAIALWRVKI
jgi:hypothetical protein